MISIETEVFYECEKLTSITFDNTNDGYVTTISGAISGTDVDVTDASVNATNLKSSYNRYWYRTVSE